MSIPLGTRLGPYEVLAQIGAGGMGEVYRATDTNLKRQVAIKVLPPTFAGDAERLTRFQREAELLASLNHPHIAQIHGLEKSDGTIALVMELVEGPTLADRIASGAIPVDEALPIARQIADALEAAHEQGIVHRDLKPANIKVRLDGTVKVLDFGLAKAVEPAHALSPGASRSPTITSPALTEHGIILGTAAYMSPEQARGRPVDKRADVWAFGCVLYEMLTGRRAFAGEDVALTLSSVLQREPDWDALPPDVPALLAAFLRRCLAKDPRQRVRDVGDIRLVLDGAFGLARVPTQDAPRPALALWQRPAPMAAVGLGVAALTALTTWTVTRPAPAPPALVTRTAVIIPPTQALVAGGRRGMAISPAATHIVYAADQQLYVRALDELDARPLAGTEGTTPSDPFFSPDGGWVGFYSSKDGALQKVALGGGAATSVRLTAARSTFGASWGEDDTIVFGQEGQGILRVSAAGGQPEVLVAVEAPARIQQPQLLPGGRAVLYTRCESGGCSTPGAWDAAQIVVEDLTTHDRTVVIDRGTDARYLASGHLVYALGNTLLAVPFDLTRRVVTGGSVPLVEGVRRAGISGAINADVSRTGTLAYWRGEDEPLRTLVWVDREGREEAIPAPPRPYWTPNLSPDGKRLVIFANDADRDLWTWDFGRATLSRLTGTTATELLGEWTPDGQRVVFNSDREGTRALYWRAADGAGPVELLLKSPDPLWPMGITPGGRLVYGRGEYLSTTLHVLALDAERRSQPLGVPELAATDAEISPDGHWLAYRSNLSGSDEVYVQPFPALDRRWLISTGGGTEPLWSPDGRELFYRREAGVMAVPVKTGNGFDAGTPSLLLAGPYLVGGGRSYDISRDGKRFLMIKAVDGTDSRRGPSGPRQIVVVQHWFEELKVRVPLR